MEHWEYLKPGGYRFVYRDTLFSPGTDSFLLSAFPHLKPGLRVCDLGCGTGLLGLLLLQRQSDLSVTGLELLPEAAALAEKAAAVNDLSEKLAIRQGDIRQVRTLLPAGGFDLVISNPPYYQTGSGRPPLQETLRIARSELNCALEEICCAAAFLLHWGGTFCLVHKPERLTDVLSSMRQAQLEPKRLRFVSKTACSPPSLLLAEGRRGGRPGLSVEAPLILQTPEGLPTAEVNAVYFRTQEAGV